VDPEIPGHSRDDRGQPLNVGRGAGSARAAAAAVGGEWSACVPSAPAGGEMSPGRSGIEGSSSRSP
jgi:hypothetical protein